MGDDRIIHDLARIVWGEDPNPGLRRPAHGFPRGHLLGLARGVSPLSEEAVAQRRRVAAGLTDLDIDTVVAVQQDSVGALWEIPWELLGFVTPAGAPGIEAALGLPGEEGPEDPLAFALVAAGTTKPAEALAGLVAPPPVAALVLRTEGFVVGETGDLTRTRMYVAVGADGRWWLRSFHRPGGTTPQLPASRPDEAASGDQLELGGPDIAALARLMGLDGADGADYRAPLHGVRVGRNDPCPCGSGRKFKVCHGGGPR